jgi:hypothetical protein
MLRIGEIQYIYLLSDILKKPNPLFQTSKEIECTGIDFIMNYLDDCFLDGRFDDANEFFGQLDPDKMAGVFIISALMISLKAADKLPNRAIFFEKAANSNHHLNSLQKYK